MTNPRIVAMVRFDSEDESLEFDCTGYSNPVKEAEKIVNNYIVNKRALAWVEYKRG